MNDSSDSRGSTLPAKLLMDVAAVGLPVVTGILQLMKDEKSYELIFLSLAFFALYAYLRVLMGNIADLRAGLDTVSARHQRYVQITNATIANLFSDVSAFAGERSIGSLTVDEACGAMVYLKSGWLPLPPDGHERRTTFHRTTPAP